MTVVDRRLTPFVDPLPLPARRVVTELARLAIGLEAARTAFTVAADDQHLPAAVDALESHAVTWAEMPPCGSQLADEPAARRDASNQRLEVGVGRV